MTQQAACRKLRTQQLHHTTCSTQHAALPAACGSIPPCLTRPLCPAPAPQSDTMQKFNELEEEISKWKRQVQVRRTHRYTAAADSVMHAAAVPTMHAAAVPTMHAAAVCMVPRMPPP